VEKGYKVLEGNSTGRFGSSRIISRAFYLRSFTDFRRVAPLQRRRPEI
jgi:hypothetical protein